MNKQFEKLPNAIFAPSVQDLEAFWAESGPKKTWVKQPTPSNPNAGSFSGPERDEITIGLKGAGTFNALKVEGVMFVSMGNYISEGENGKSNSKLFDFLSGALGADKARALKGKKFITMEAVNGKPICELEGLGSVRGLKVAALTMLKKNGEAGVKIFMAPLPNHTNTFIGMAKPKQPKPTVPVQSGFEAMPDINAAPVATGPITDSEFDDVTW